LIQIVFINATFILKVVLLRSLVGRPGLGFTSATLVTELCLRIQVRLVILAFIKGLVLPLLIEVLVLNYLGAIIRLVVLRNVLRCLGWHLRGGALFDLVDHRLVATKILVDAVEICREVLLLWIAVLLTVGWLMLGLLLAKQLLGAKETGAEHR
jgi:hypothetical protein